MVHDFDGYPMGRGFINRNSKIRIRMLKELLAEDGVKVRGIYERSDAKEREKEGMRKTKGFLATCSCSRFMDFELFTKTIREAARNAHVRLRQVEFRTQAPDHPILWATDESYYLKFYIFQVVHEK